MDKIKTIKIKPISLGIIADPPMLVLSYDKITEFIEVTPTATGPWIDQLQLTEEQKDITVKRRKRKMPLRYFTDKSNVTKTTYAMKQRHEEYLKDVLSITIEKELRIIQEIIKGKSNEEALALVNKEYEINPNEDLNKLDTLELDRKKAIMDEEFMKNLILPGDPGYVYDKVVEIFDKLERQPSEWDEEEEEDKDKENQNQGLINPPTESKAVTEDQDIHDQKLPEENKESNQNQEGKIIIPVDLNESQELKEILVIPNNENNDINFLDKVIEEAEAIRAIEIEFEIQAVAETDLDDKHNLDNNALQITSLPKEDNQSKPSKEDLLKKDNDQWAKTMEMQSELSSEAEDNGNVLGIEIETFKPEEEDDFWN